MLDDQDVVREASLLLRKISGKKQSEIIRFLEPKGFVTVKDISIQLKIDKVYLSRLLVELKNIGILVKDKRSYRVNTTRLGLVSGYCSQINTICDVK